MYIQQYADNLTVPKSFDSDQSITFTSKLLECLNVAYGAVHNVYILIMAF